MYLAVSAVVMLASPLTAERMHTAPAIASMTRLAALTARPLPGDTAETESRKARLAALSQFLGKFERDHRFTSREQLNLLTDIRDLVSAGTDLAVLPEEALCWQRVGLNLSMAYYRVVVARVRSGELPPHTLDQSEAQVELFRKQYWDALCRCFPNAPLTTRP